MRLYPPGSTHDENELVGGGKKKSMMLTGGSMRWRDVEAGETRRGGRVESRCSRRETGTARDGRGRQLRREVDEKRLGR